ncbi:MAG TPA: MarR family transcriptional regulator [Anaerolineaceae bacterium]|nr:MarR family transcriptional regulator [Anaerolineaceae bacterium]HPN50222.1 MarR family transcriptional regulator [Anaerolineaceae bacterium]
MTQHTALSETLHQWIDLFMRNSAKHWIQSSRRSGLSLAQVGALFRISKKCGGVSEIGEELGVTSAAASQLLDRLFQQGYILRQEDPRDRRAKQITLTEKGQQVLSDSVNSRQEWLDELANLMTPEEQEQVLAALKILIDRTRQLESGQQMQ